MSASDDQQTDGSSGAEGAAPKRKMSGRARAILIGLAVIILVVIVVWFIHHETRGKYFEETNDAQIEADAVTVAPRISGYVSAVLIRDNQDVRAGQPLIRIDPRDYRAQAARAEAAIAQAEAGIENAEAMMHEQQATIEQSRAQLADVQAKAAYDAAQVRRYTPLAASGAEKAEQLALLRTTAAQSAAQARAQAATVEAQERHVATLRAQVRSSTAQKEAGQAQLDAANVDVNATTLRASINGRVGDRTVTLGQYAQAGTRLLSVVPLDKLYVVANFKETQLALMRPGQPAKIRVDALSGTEVSGHVESVSPGTGAKFSLIPPNNATGNFTKIVQRVPVRIAVDATEQARRLLVPGLSVTVEVDTISARNELDHIRDAQRQYDRKDR